MIFLLLTILNIPALYFFYSGQESDFREMTGLNKIFFQFSLGNIGENRFSCATINYAQGVSEVPIKCEIGVLKQLVSFGLVSHHHQMCVPRLIESSFAYEYADKSVHIGRYEGNEEGVKEYSQFLEYSQGCGSIVDKDFLNSNFRNELQEQFSKSCLDKYECNVTMPYQNMSPNCRDEVEERSKYSKVGFQLRE